MMDVMHSISLMPLGKVKDNILTEFASLVQLEFLISKV